MKKITNKIKHSDSKHQRRKHRVKTMIKINSDRPRLVASRSVKHIYAQLIEENGNVLAAASDLGLKKGKKTEKAKEVGMTIAKKALEKGIKNVVFDRNGFLYHGRVKAIAEGARESGLQF